MRIVVGTLIAGALCACSGASSEFDAGSTSDAGSISGMCPKRLKFTVLAGTRAEVGWSGYGHGTVVPAESFFMADIIECDSECRQCAFEGPSVEAGAVNLRRCLSQPSQICSDDSECPPWECIMPDPTQPNLPRVCSGLQTVTCSTAADCPASSCRNFLGPAIPLPNGGCGVSYLEKLDTRAPLSGTIDLRSGAVVMETFQQHAAGPLGFENCPRCEGDPVSNDGRAEGLCQVSPYPPARPLSDFHGTCDVHAIGSLASQSGAYSLDCAPPLVPNISLDYSGARTSGARLVLGTEQVDCGSGSKCWCGLCDGVNQACNQDSDCSGGMKCMAPHDLSLSIAPNACRTSCDWDVEAQRGTCIANGLPDRTVSCFPEEVGSELIARGSTRRVSETSFTIELGNVACRDPIPADPSNQFLNTLNTLLGLPGPQLTVLRLQVDQEF